MGFSILYAVSIISIIYFQEAAKICGGGGGGRPDTAQAGGKNPDKIENAMEVATTFASEVLND